jgi:hypothetical protein
VIAVYSANPGNPALCLALNQPGVLSAGQSCCPGGENTTYNLAAPLIFNGVTYPAGTALQGTRIGLNPSLVNNSVPGNFLGNDAYVSDQASSMADPLDPFNFEATRGLSAWDLTHNFVATYDCQLPLERLSQRGRFPTQGWSPSGIIRASTGFPVILSTSGDNSLQGSNPNGVNKTLFAQVGISKGLGNAVSHRFRDTFSVELLPAGVPIERVSILLEDQSVRVTEKHYNPWVRSRQEQLEADVERTWTRDPVLTQKIPSTNQVQMPTRMQ